MQRSVLILMMAELIQYIDPQQSNPGAFVSAFLTQMASPPAGMIVDGPGYVGSGNVALGVTPIDHSDETEAGPMAYINYIFINKDYDLSSVRTLSKKVTTSAAETGTSANGTAHEELTISDIIKVPGYVYIYLSNDNLAIAGQQVDVFFDNFEVMQNKSKVVQWEDYYAFGLTFNSYVRENTTPQDFKYNGKELQDELNLQWLDFGWRMYDPAIARWMAVDPLTDQMRRHSPYNYAFDNPMRFVDPDGMSPTVPVTADGTTEEEKQQNVQQFVSQVNEVTGGSYEVVGGNLQAKDGNYGSGPNAEQFQSAIMSENEIPVNVVKDDPNTIVDGYTTTNVDVGDLDELNTAAKGAVFSHVLTERMQAGEGYADAKQRSKDMSGIEFTIGQETLVVSNFSVYHNTAKATEIAAVSYHTGIDKSRLHIRGEGALFDYGAFSFQLINK